MVGMNDCRFVGGMDFGFELVDDSAEAVTGLLVAPDAESIVGLRLLYSASVIFFTRFGGGGSSGVLTSGALAKLFGSMNSFRLTICDAIDSRLSMPPTPFASRTYG